MTRARDLADHAATQELRAFLETFHGVTPEPVPVPRGGATPAIMYKLVGKMFAILSVRGDAFVIVKCDPALADMLRQTYAGVGARSHLDKRFWISLDLDTDVPMDEIRKLIEGSYALIRSGLTRKQREALDASAG